MYSPLSTLRRIGNRQLLHALRDLSRRDRQLEADLLAHIAEVDSRKLYREEGYPSLFQYLVEELGFSEDAAYNRIQAARTARAHPEILERIRKGELHVTAVKLLAPHITRANHAELLERAKHKTKRQIDELVADLAPRPDAPPLVRRVPEPKAPEARLGEPATGAGSRSAWESPAARQAATAAAVLTARSSPRRPEPLGGERFKVQFTADRAFVETLRELQALLRHQVPDGDLARILGRGLGLLLEDTKRRKFGKTQRPAREPRPVGDEPPSRHVPNSVRREVAERDGESCSYRGRSGKVCGSKDFLEYEHQDAWAKHGAHRSRRMRLLCRAHNLLAAEGEFGRAHMDRFARSEARGDPAPTRSGTSEVRPGKAGLEGGKM